MEDSWHVILCRQVACNDVYVTIEREPFLDIRTANSRVSLLIQCIAWPVVDFKSFSTARTLPHAIWE